MITVISVGQHVSTCALQVSQLSSTAANMLAVRERKTALELEASALELAKGKIHREKRRWRQQLPSQQSRWNS